MKIAICLYGQPRNYKEGFENIHNFISKHKDIEFDFFYHVWKIENNSNYDKSPWRNISSKDIYVNDMEIILDDLKNLYKPKLYEEQNQIKYFDEDMYIDTIAYKNIENETKKKNINNTISQMYSRNKVRNLLNNYMTTNNLNYEMVIICRFDYQTKIELKLDSIDTSCVYACNICQPRKIIPDNFIVAPTSVFLNWFNIYENFNKILDNIDLCNKLKSYQENFEINPENLVLVNYLFYYNDLDRVIFTPLIYNFVTN